MTPKEKAKELFEKMLLHQHLTPEYDRVGQAKRTSLISIDEILLLGKKLPLEILEYYLEVKKEIETL